MAAIGDINRFSHPGKLVSYFGLNPRVRQSGLGAIHHGRISKPGRSHARAMLVEAAWASAKAPGLLHAIFVRSRVRRGHQIAAVALARKLMVLCWDVLTKEEDYLWVRPALVANKTRAMELQAGRPQRKGAISAVRPTPTTSRSCGIRSCNWPNRPSATTRALSTAGERTPEGRGARAAQSGKERIGRLAALAADAPSFVTRSLARVMNSTSAQKPLADLIRRTDFDPVFFGEVHKGEDVDLSFVEQSGQLGQAGAQLIGDVAPLFACRRRRFLGEGGGYKGRDDAATVLVAVRQRVAREVYAAALPCRTQHLGGGGFEAFVSVGDHQLAPRSPRRGSLRRKSVQNVSASEGQISTPNTSCRPSPLTPMAITTAAETMRPPRRTFR
jgi:Transposase IS116/IS110/IS902 family